MKYQRIQDLRTDNDITIKDMSASLGLNRDVYSRYEKGNREFPVDILIEVANIFDVTIDYLVGRSDFKKAADKNTSARIHERLTERITYYQRFPRKNAKTKKH